jgi:hypothetical protein
MIKNVNSKIIEWIKHQNVLEKIKLIGLYILKETLVCVNFIFLIFMKSGIMIKNVNAKVKIIEWVTYQNVLETIKFIFLIILKVYMICIKFIFLIFVKSFIMILKMIIHHITLQYYLYQQTVPSINFSTVSSMVLYPSSNNFNVLKRFD